MELKLFLVVLMLYPSGMNTDRWLGPYESEAGCRHAIEVLTVNQREDGPSIAVYCENGCGQQRVPQLDIMRQHMAATKNRHNQVVCRNGVC